jgi:hypothetical protein
MNEARTAPLPSGSAQCCTGLIHDAPFPYAQWNREHDESENVSYLALWMHVAADSLRMRLDIACAACANYPAHAASQYGDINYGK